MGYVAWSVVFGEQPSASKWNILGANDASFNDGTGIGTGAITATKISSGSSFVWNASTPAVSAVTGTFTSASATMRHSQVGKIVEFQLAITLTTVGTGSGIRCAVPVTAQSAVGTLGGYRERAIGGMTGTVSLASATLLTLHEYDNAQTLSDGMVFQCYGSYEAA